MIIHVEENLNCGESEQFFFHELGPKRRIRGILGLEAGSEVEYQIAGVDPGPVFTAAYAQKIADSGAGYAYLITGGGWGIRLRPAAYSAETWDLSNSRQWGEAFKIYGEEKDILIDE